MKGYKDSTKTVYLTGKSPGSKGAAKAAQTLKAFKKGEAPMKKAEGGRVEKGRETFDDDNSRANDMAWKQQYQKGSNKTTRQERDHYLEPDPQKRPLKTSPQDIHDYITNRKPMKKAEGGRVDTAQDKKTVAAGVHKHERNMHPGKPLTKMASGGRAMVRSRGPLIKPNC